MVRIIISLAIVVGYALIDRLIQRDKNRIIDDFVRDMKQDSKE